MAFYIGTIYTGTIEDQNDQCIQTKFFLLGLPLFPVESTYKVSKNTGMEIPLNGRSVWMGYSRTTFLLLGILGMVLGPVINDGDGGSPILKGISLAMIINGVVAWVMMASGSKEKLRRNIFEQAIGYNMDPRLLPANIQAGLFQRAQDKYRERFPQSNWEQETMMMQLPEEQRSLLYTLNYYAFLLTGQQRFQVNYQRMETGPEWTQGR